MKISVVIPIYNVSMSYLQECLRSVAEQSYQNAEFIIVLDGPTDHSPEICDTYAAFDSRFKIFHRENAGAAASRNFGLDHAAGDYIMFMDSDDYWLDSNLLTEVAGLLAESYADVLSFSYCEFYTEEEKPIEPMLAHLPREKILNQKTAIKQLLKSSRNTFSSSVITKVVKRSFIEKNGIRFLEGINGEDTHFTAQLIHYAKTYDRLNRCVYAVRRHSQSTSRCADANRRVLESMLVVFDDLTKRFALNKASQSPVLDFLASPYLYALGKAAALPEPGNDLMGLKKYQYCLIHSSRFYVKGAGILANIIGLKMTVKILRVFLSFNHKSHVSIHKTSR